MKDVERWKPWFDHKKKSPTMTVEKKPNVGYVKYSDYLALRTRLDILIDQFVNLRSAVTFGMVQIELLYPTDYTEKISWQKLRDVLKETSV